MKSVLASIDRAIGIASAPAVHLGGAEDFARLAALTRECINNDVEVHASATPANSAADINSEEERAYRLEKALHTAKAFGYLRVTETEGGRTVERVPGIGERERFSAAVRIEPHVYPLVSPRSSSSHTGGDALTRCSDSVAENIPSAIPSAGIHKDECQPAPSTQNCVHDCPVVRVETTFVCDERPAEQRQGETVRVNVPVGRETRQPPGESSPVVEPVRVNVPLAKAARNAEHSDDTANTDLERECPDQDSETRRADRECTENATAETEDCDVLCTADGPAVRCVVVSNEERTDEATCSQPNATADAAYAIPTTSAQPHESTLPWMPMSVPYYPPTYAVPPQPRQMLVEAEKVEELLSGLRALQALFGTFAAGVGPEKIGEIQERVLALGAQIARVEDTCNQSHTSSAKLVSDLETLFAQNSVPAAVHVPLAGQRALESQASNCESTVAAPVSNPLHMATSNASRDNRLFSELDASESSADASAEHFGAWFKLNQALPPTTSELAHAASPFPITETFGSSTSEESDPVVEINLERDYQMTSAAEENEQPLSDVPHNYEERPVEQMRTAESQGESTVGYNVQLESTIHNQERPIEQMRTAESQSESTVGYNVQLESTIHTQERPADKEEADTVTREEIEREMAQFVIDVNSDQAHPEENSDAATVYVNEQPQTVLASCIESDFVDLAPSDEVVGSEMQRSYTQQVISLEDASAVSAPPQQPAASVLGFALDSAVHFATEGANEAPQLG